MFSRDRGTVKLPSKLLALGWGFWALSGTWALADDVWAPTPASNQQKTKHSIKKEAAKRQVPACGTLGYGPPGLHEGFQGFGLGFHPGYGYGGKALGVGAEGGYPFYGGPGYPHPGPCLNRFGHEKPFAYFAGPGYPSSERPNFFGTVVPLASDQPVIEIGDGPGEADYGSGYGAYTGLLPYPEATFAPFTTAIGTAGSDAGVGAPVPPRPRLESPARHASSDSRPRLRPPQAARPAWRPSRQSVPQG